LTDANNSHLELS